MLKKVAMITFSIVICLIVLMLGGCIGGTGKGEDLYQFDPEPGRKAISAAETAGLYVSLPDDDSEYLLKGITVEDYKRLKSYLPPEPVLTYNYHTVMETDYRLPSFIIYMANELMKEDLKIDGIITELSTIPELVFFESKIPTGSSVELVYSSDYSLGVRGVVIFRAQEENELDMEPGKAKKTDIEIVFAPNGEGGYTLERLAPLRYERPSDENFEFSGDRHVTVPQDNKQLTEPDIVVPGDFTTIQQAIDASEDGDTIVVEPGEYKENIKIERKEIILRSQDPYDEEIVASTVINGGGQGSTVTIIGAQEMELSGFTITGGSGIEYGYYEPAMRVPRSGIYGGGITINSSSPVIKNNIIKNNTIPQQERLGNGGGIAITQRSFPLIIDNVIEDNEADIGGGIFIADLCSPTIQSNIISGNKAKYGGGVQAIKSSPYIVENTIENNEAEHDGGGLNLGGNHRLGNDGYVRCFDGTVSRVFNNIIASNKAGQRGGGIALYPGSTVTVHYNTIAENEAQTGGALDSGPSDHGDLGGDDDAVYICVMNNNVWDNKYNKGKVINVDSKKDYTRTYENDLKTDVPR